MIVVLALACGSDDRVPGLFGDSTAATDESGAPASAGVATGGATGGATSGLDSGDDDAGGSTGPLFDVAQGGSAEGGAGGGCSKVDFLFVVDNSSSMINHQQALTASFPGFIAAIEERIESGDFHIMVVDSDTKADPNNGCGECYDRCVLGQAKDCGFPGGAIGECEGLACGDIAPEAPDACDYVLGAGVIDDRWQQSCPLAGDERFLTDGQPDLSQTFSCIAQTGVNGTGNELPMGAMVAAVGMTAPGQCNAGFLRDDAILVVTVLSDALYQGEVGASPQPWFDALIAAKGGDPEAIVMLGLFRADPDQLEGPACMAGAATCGDGGFLSCHSSYPDLVSLFGDRGFAHSICVDDYEPFFSSALDAIETTCDEFEPAG
jgi:hypothetical protein